MDQGLFIDFGTTDYFKYTLGGWRSGWGRSFIRDDVAYTHAVGTSSRIYFYLDGSRELAIQFRAKPFGSTFFSLYLNNKTIEKVDLKSADWATYSVNIPADRVKTGINYILIRWNRTENVAGEALAAAIDYIRILPGPDKAEGNPLPSHTAVSSELSSGENRTSTLLLAAGMSLGYYLQVPSDEPLLGFNLGMVGSDMDKPAVDMKLEVTAVTDNSEPRMLLSKTVKPSEIGKLFPVGIDLSALKDQVIRLDLSASTSADTKARLALVGPALYTKPYRSKVAQPAKKAKNVIVVMIDTLRADHTAPYAETRVKSPAFNKLAESGALFEKFSAVEDWTKPSCATILTGLYPHTHKTQSDMGKLPSNIRMISEEMQKRGILAGAFIANGYVSGKFGFKKGWNRYTNYIREGKNTDAEHVFGDAIEWIREVKDEPFYAYIHTIDPHVPYSPPEEFLQMYDKGEYQGPVSPRRTAEHLEDIKKGKFNPSARDKIRIEALYDGEISYHDKWFGDFLEKLESLNILEETLIMVVSDHGEEFWDHGSVGHGHQIHQELIHVPFLMVWKGTIPEKTRIAENYDHTCIVPTIFEAMDLKPPDYLEGPSVLDRAMGGQSEGPQAGFSTHQGDREAVWSNNWKVLMRGPIKTFLYDLGSDPKCQTNLAAKRPITLTYLRTLLGQFHGSQDKSKWRSRKLVQKAVIKAKEEKVEMDKELEEQLKALGYFH